MTHRLIFAAFLTVFVSATALSLGAQQSRPTGAVDDEAAIAASRAWLEPLAAAAKKTPSPGMAIGVYRRGKVIFEFHAGFASLEHGVPIGPDTAFRIASTSKQFTAACIFLLALDGKLDLDADVASYFDEYRGFPEPVTIRQLVHHTSGIRDYLYLASFSGLKNFDTEKGLELIFRQSALEFAPGTRYSYSNSNYMLLGEIVRRVSKKSLRDFAHERIFEPLGMASTHFHDDSRELIPHRAEGHAKSGRGWQLDRTELATVGDGGLVTTVNDLARWDEIFYGDDLGHEGALREHLLRRGRLTDENAAPLDYAGGLVHGHWRGLDHVFHGGAYVGFRAEVLRFPSEGLTFVCLANFAEAQPDPVCFRLAETFLGDALKPVDAPPRDPGTPDSPAPFRADPAKLADVYGRYTSPDIDGVWTVARKAFYLGFESGGVDVLLLSPSADDAFAAGPFKVTFRRDDDDTVTGFDFVYRNGAPYHFTRVPAEEHK